MTGSSPTVPPPLSRSRIDRDDLGRLPEGALARYGAESSTRVVLVSEGHVACRTSGPRLALFAPSEVHGAESVAYLGTADLESDERSVPESTSDVQRRAFIVQRVPGRPTLDDVEWRSVRQLGHLMGDRDAGLATQATAIVNWHSAAGFCSVCGGVTAAVKAGWSRVCSTCETEHFPRTDPAVIVAVHDERDRLLLGSNAQWDSRRFSLLAGFVEAGESAESAIQREIAEEAGISVIQPEYIGSQPWPFPRSLMLGYRARLEPGADPDAVIADGEEILSLRWFTRDELRADVKRGDLELPGSSSIARWIIDDWLGKRGGDAAARPASPQRSGIDHTRTQNRTPA